MEEIEFVKHLGFWFFQIWFYNGVLGIETLQEPKGNGIKKVSFPVILHVVLDMPEYEKYSKKLINLLNHFGRNEVIVHPVCKAEQITNKTMHLLKEKIESLHQELAVRNIKLYVENNSLIDGFFNTVEDLGMVFDVNPEIGLLLDLAHINNYDHLSKIVEMRFSECIHIADKHFNIIHEHPTLWMGN